MSYYSSKFSILAVVPESFRSIPSTVPRALRAASSVPTDEPSAPDSVKVKDPPDDAGAPTNMSVPSTIYVLEAFVSNNGPAPTMLP